MTRQDAGDLGLPRSLPAPTEACIRFTGGSRTSIQANADFACVHYRASTGPTATAPCQWADRA
eukprot:13911917-Alexandrium_andersonii.AAC.1